MLARSLSTVRRGEEQTTAGREEVREGRERERGGGSKAKTVVGRARAGGREAAQELPRPHSLGGTGLRRRRGVRGRWRSAHGTSEFVHIEKDGVVEPQVAYALRGALEEAPGPRFRPNVLQHRAYSLACSKDFACQGKRLKTWY